MLAPSGGDAPPGDPVGDAASGPPSDLPFRAELEASFGADLGHIKVYLGRPGPLRAIGARALTRGDTITFADANPDKTLVAEEVAHVLQNARGRAQKPYSTNADGSEKRAKAAAVKAAAGETVAAGEVGSADADVQAGWLGSAWNAVTGFVSDSYTYVKESVWGDSKGTDIKPDQWREKQHAFMAQFGDPALAEDDVLCAPQLVTDKWYGTAFVYDKAAYEAGYKAWLDATAQVQANATAVTAGGTSTAGGTPPTAPDMSVPEWTAFAPAAQRDGIPVFKEEDFDTLGVAMEDARHCLRDEIVAALNASQAADESAVQGVERVKTILASLRSASPTLDPTAPAFVPPDNERRLSAFYSFWSPTGEEVPEIFSHPLFAGNPAAVLALADLMDPIADLREALELHQFDRPKCMAIVADWARKHPSLGTQALADPAIEQLIFTSGSAADVGNTVGGIGLIAGGVGVATLNPLLSGAGVAGAVMGDAAADQFATLDPDVLRMMKLLQNGGHLEGTDTEQEAREALVSGDADAFLRVWGQIVHKKDIFDRLTRDDRFRKEVREKVPDAWDSFLATIKGGSIETNLEAGLTKEEQKLIEQFSGATIRELADAFNPGLSTLWMVRDATVTNALRNWNQQVSNILAVNQETSEAQMVLETKLNNARFILCSLFAARQGVTLEDEIKRGVGGAELEMALGFIGIKNGSKPAEVTGIGAEAKIDHTGATTVESYGETLSDEEKAALKYQVLLKASGQLYAELQKYSFLNLDGSGKLWGTSGSELIAILERARREARELLAPPQLDCYPALQQPFSRKVTEAMVYLAEVFNDAYEAEGEGQGSLRHRISRELNEADKGRALQLIGARPAPTQHLVDAAMAQLAAEAEAGGVKGIHADVQAGGIEAGLDSLQTHATEFAQKLWTLLQFTVAADRIVDVVKTYEVSIPAPAKEALKLRPEMKSMPLRMLEAAYKVLGGSLGGHIVEVLKADPKGAQTVLDALQLGPVGKYAVAADAELMSVLGHLDEQDASLAAQKGERGAKKQELAAKEAENAKVRALVQGQIPARQQLAWLSQRVFALLETPPVKQDEVGELLKGMVAVDRHLEAPVEALGPNLSPDGVPSVKVLDGQRLDLYIYKHYNGIDLAAHLGRHLDQTHLDEAGQTLGIPVPRSAAPAADPGILNSCGKLSALADELDIDETRVHGNIEDGAGWEHNQSFIVTAAGIVKDLDARMTEVEKAYEVQRRLSQSPGEGSVGAAVVTSVGLADAKRELLIAIGSIGTGEERRVVDALFEKAYGVSLKFRLNRITMQDGDMNAEQIRRLAEGRLTVTDHLRAMVEAGDKDEVYRHVFKASAEMRRNVLADDHLLRQVATKFGSEFLQTFMKVCEGTQQAADLLYGRDADDGSGNPFWQWVASMGWSTDEAGMKSDLKLHLDALKARIEEANSGYVVVRGDCLWNITKRMVGDPLRWPELWEENKNVIKKNPNLIYPRTKLKVPKAWISANVAKELAEEYLRIVLDPDVRSLLGEQLSAKDRFEMESIVMGGGSVSAGNQAALDLDAANGPAFIASIKKMDDSERKALLADASFVALMSSKLDGAQYQQAMSILATGKSYDTLSDLLGALSGNDYGVFNTIDEAAIFDALAALGPDELNRLKNSPILAAKVHKFLDSRKDEGGLFEAYLATASAAPAPDAEPADVRAAEMKRQRQHLLAKYEIRLTRGAVEDRDKLYKVAQEVFKERGEVKVPVAGAKKAKDKKGVSIEPEKEIVKVFDQDARNELWGKVGPLVRAKHSGALAMMVEDAVLARKDPSTDRVDFALESTLGFNKEIDAAKAAIASAADITVAREWSNILQPDTNGLTLKKFYEAFAFARQQLKTHDKVNRKAMKAADKTAHDEKRNLLEAEYYRRLTEFKGFRLDLNRNSRGTVAKEGKTDNPFFFGMFNTNWLNTVGAKDQLALREAIRDRIKGLPKNVVGQAIGIVDEDGALLGKDGKALPKDKKGAAPTTSAMTLSADVPGHDGSGGKDVGVELADLDLLMSDDRKARMGDVSAKEKYDHTRGDTFIGKALGGSDLNKAAWNVAYYNTMLDQAEERKENEKVTTIDADEGAELEVKLKAIGKSLQDYSATKSFYAEIIKGVVVAVIAAVSTALTGGAAAPLWATMLTAAVTAGAKVAIDELILGNDYEALADGIPMIIGDTVKAGLEQTLAAGLKSFAARDNVFSKGTKWILDTQEELQKYAKKAGPLKGAMTDALMAGFSVGTDPFLEPITKFLKPDAWAEVYKHGLGSTWTGAMNKLDKDVRGMPKTFVSKVSTTFLTKFATRSADKAFEWAVTGKESDKGLPGMIVDPVRPKEPGRWESVSKKLSEHFSKKSGYGTKAVYSFLAQQLISEGILSMKDGHSFGDSWTEEGLKKLVLKFGTDRLKAYIKSVGAGYGEYTKTTTALRRTEEESGNLKALGTRHGLEEEKMKDLYYHFITNGIGEESSGKGADLFAEINNFGGFGRVSTAEFEKHFLGPRLTALETRKAEYEKACTDANKPIDQGVIDTYQKWVFGDVKSVDSRAKTDIESFGMNLKSLEQAGMVWHQAPDMTQDEMAMLNLWMDDATRAGDVTEGKLNEKLDFKKAYLVTKNTAAMLHVGDAITNPERKSAFKDWLKTRDRSFWDTDAYRFTLADADIADKVRLMVDAFDKASPPIVKSPNPAP